MNFSAGISVTNIILYLSAVSEKSYPTNPPIEKSARNAFSLSSIFVNLTIWSSQSWFPKPSLHSDKIIIVPPSAIIILEFDNVFEV